MRWAIGLSSFRLQNSTACLGAATVAASLAAGVAPARADCTCRGPEGRATPLGQSMCMRAADGRWRMGVCDMALNNSTWRMTDKDCSPAAFTPAGNRKLALQTH